MKTVLALLSFVFLLGGCRGIDPKRDTASVTLERTGCLGACPVYVLTLYADGFVRFEGRTFVRKNGVFTKRVSPAAVAAVFDQIEKIGFWSLQDRYYASTETVVGGETTIQLPPTDMPTRYVTVRLAERTKRIVDYWGAPPRLHALEQLIDATGDVSDWIGISMENEPPNASPQPTAPSGRGSL